jgi:hypothetical protein
MTWRRDRGHDGWVNGGMDPGLPGALAKATTDAAPASTTMVMERLARLDGPGWLRLDESVRHPYPGRPRPEEVPGWRAALASRSAPPGVVAASMCRDGRVREAAVAVLADMPGPVAAAALAVRVADWVPEVSAAAEAAVGRRTGPHDAAAVVPVLLALGQRQRGQRAAARYLASVAAGPAATLEALAGTGDRARRLWALKALTARGLLASTVLAARAMHDPDPVVALWCAQSLARPHGQLSPEAGPQLLGSARSAVRAFAAGHLADDHLTTRVLHRLLLDRSAAVRAVARWQCKRRGEDPGPVYRAALEAATRPRQAAAALAGLDDEHDDTLPAAAVPFLAHPSPAVRRAAAQAVGHHASADDIQWYLVPLLLDSSAKVVTAALRHLRGYALPDSVLASLDTASTIRSRRTALSIRQQSGTWNRVHADLAVMHGHDADLAEAARTDLLDWLKHGAATSYGKPSTTQAEEIATLLTTPTLSPRQRREIAFAAGIRMPAAGWQEGAGPTTGNRSWSSPGTRTARRDAGQVRALVTGEDPSTLQRRHAAWRTSCLSHLLLGISAVHCLPHAPELAWESIPGATQDQLVAKASGCPVAGWWPSVDCADRCRSDRRSDGRCASWRPVCDYLAAAERGVKKP